MELLSHLAHTPYPRAADLFCGSHLPFYQWFGSLNEAGKHAHAIDKQATIGRIMDAGLHTHAIQTQFSSLDHLRLRGELNYPIIERVHGFRTNEVCPTKKGSIVWDLFKIDAREPAQHQAIIDPIFCLSSNSTDTSA